MKSIQELPYSSGQAAQTLTMRQGCLVLNYTAVEYFHFPRGIHPDYAVSSLPDSGIYPKYNHSSLVLRFLRYPCRHVFRFCKKQIKL